MVINIEKIEKKQDNFLKDMEINDLQKYLDNTAKTYYNNIILNDKVKVNAMKNNLNKILSIHDDKNMDLYILFALNNAFREILIKSVNSDLDLNLVKIPKPELNKNINIRKSKLDDVIEYIRNKQIEKAVNEFYNKNPCYNDFLELFNQKDYLI